MNRVARFALTFVFVLVANAADQSKFPCPENEIASYTSFRTSEMITIDGKLEEPIWQRAPQSPRFIDILTGKPTIHSTRAMVVWDATNLYVAYRMEEPFVRAKYRTRTTRFITIMTSSFSSPAATPTTNSR